MGLFAYVTGGDRRLAAPLMGSVGARMAGLELSACLEDAAAHLAALAALADSFAPDILFPIMDLTLEAEALGLPVVFPENGVPSVAEHPVSTPEDLERLALPDPLQASRMPLFIEVAEGMGEIAPALCGAYVIGPLTLAAELAGAEEFAVRIITEPEFISEMIAFSLEAVSGYAGMLAARVDVVVILEPTAVMLSPDHFSSFASPALYDLCDNIRGSGACPVLHVCGDTAPLLVHMADAGADGISLDSQVDVAKAAARIKPDQLLMGNIAPVEVMLEMDAAGVRNACENLLADIEDIPNFVLATGCDLPAATPRENISAFMQTVRRRP
ncbi:MAG: uroporphyrinogen decarboxylase family protein [Actinobacteria bacterium]|nr:uroporphyrinogen decarboxylase family protein [Actinomycetota bacterium]